MPKRHPRKTLDAARRQRAPQLERTFPMPDALAGPYGAMAVLLPAFTKMAIDVGIYEPMFDTVYISLQALLRGEPWSVTLEGAPPTA